MDADTAALLHLIIATMAAVALRLPRMLLGVLLRGINAKLFMRLGDGCCYRIHFDTGNMRRHY